MGSDAASSGEGELSNAKVPFLYTKRVATAFPEMPEPLALSVANHPVGRKTCGMYCVPSLRKSPRRSLATAPARHAV